MKHIRFTLAHECGHFILEDNYRKTGWYKSLKHLFPLWLKIIKACGGTITCGPDSYPKNPNYLIETGFNYAFYSPRQRKYSNWQRKRRM